MPEQKNALVAIVDREKSEIWDIRPKYMPSNIDVDTYFKRSIMAVFENQMIANIAKTEVGARSIFSAIGKALQMGLQIGGTIPQAYLLPFGDKAELCPTASGYKFIALSEPAVLKSFDVKCVYEGENFSVDFGAGEIIHNWDGKSERGKLIGVYGKWVDLNDEFHVDFMSQKQIDHIRVTFSKQPEGKAWKGSYDEMAMKVASKKFLKPYASLKEGLQMSLLHDDVVYRDDQSGDILNRAESRLKNVIDVTPIVEDNKPIEKEKKSNEKAAEKTHEKTHEKKSSNNDLF